MSDKGDFGHLDLGFRFIESPKPIDPADYGPQKVDTKSIDERNRRIAEHLANLRERRYAALGLGVY